MTPTQLRCGRISYTNDLPIYAAFDAGAVRFPGTLTSGVPATLNRAMLEGSLDCGPVSSFFYAEHADQFDLLPGVCIGSRCEVRSIYCVSPVPPRDLSAASIAVTKESATGRALLAAICKTHYGFAPAFVESDDPLREYQERGVPCLVIGDKAIDAYLADPAHAYDLGTLWHGFAGADMVYAVWAVRREVATHSPDAVSAVGAALRAAQEWGVEHVASVIERANAAIPRPAGFYEDYYRSLNFRFDDAARSGLQSFFNVCADCGLLDRAPVMKFFNEELEHV